MLLGQKCRNFSERLRSLTKSRQHVAKFTLLHISVVIIIMGERGEKRTVSQLQSR